MDVEKAKCVCKVPFHHIWRGHRSFRQIWIWVVANRFARVKFARLFETLEFWESSLGTKNTLT